MSMSNAVTSQTIAQTNINPACNEAQRKQVKSVVQKHRPILPTAIRLLGCAKSVSIDWILATQNLLNAHHISSRMNTNCLYESIFKKRLKMVVLNIRTAHGELLWASLCRKVEKCVVDYGEINAATGRSSYPVPKSEDILHAMGTCKYFSRIDLSQGFN